MKRLLRQAAARLGVALGGGTWWAAEDYAAPEPPLGMVQDHWAAQSHDVTEPDGVVTLQVETRPEVVTMRAARPPIQSPLGLIEFAEPQAELPFGPVTTDAPLAFDWFDAHVDPIESVPDDPVDFDLPGFDPDATSARPTSEVFDRPHVFRSDTLAGLLARETAIASPEGRARAARVFGDALDEGRWPRLYQSWTRLAPEVECPRALALAFELRELWEESPHLWLHRSTPNRVGGYHEGGRGQFSWRRALAMARAAPHQNAAMLLDDDLVAEWNELSAPCPGFWNFADYVELRATGDEAEADVMAVLARFGRERRGLRHQEGCAHLDFTRPGWTLSIVGNIETGPPMARSYAFGEDAAVPGEEE